jgi:U4/U6.U5 tri-snRNP-associated protein 2
MAKRHADWPLGEEHLRTPPASKKARLEADEDGPSRNGEVLVLRNGRDREQDERGGKIVLAASSQEGEPQGEIIEDPKSPDIDETLPAAPKRQSAPVEGYSDLYLDTINRAVLDFDFEKLCSISLSNINVYACLVCGKYYQGRGPKSHAYFHGLDVGHHVFVNMETKRVFVLPEGYEVRSKSLDDIKYVVDPTFAKGAVTRLDKEVHDAWDLMGRRYRPGKEGQPNISLPLLLSPLRIYSHITYIQHVHVLVLPEQQLIVTVRVCWDE